mgnify:CR=1 FL=1
MKFYDDFIGEDWSNITMDFVIGDDEEKYKKNLKSQPSDWYYNNKKLTYIFNKYGHRCKDISEINLNNYILFSDRKSTRLNSSH